MKKFCFFIICLSAISFSFAQNVGVGTPAPDSKFHVVDTVNLGDGINGAFVNIQNATQTSPIGTMSGIRFRLDGVITGANTRYKGGIFFQKTSGFGVGSLLFASNAIGNNTNVTAADAHMAITSAGNVGIGTITPTEAKLQIHEPAGNTQFIASAGSNLPGISAFVPGSSPSLGYNVRYQSGYKFMGAGYGGFWQFSPSLGKLYYYYSSTSGAADGNVSSSFALAIDSSGQLGIGVSAPKAPLHVSGNVVFGSSSIAPATGYKLSVDGKIISEEIKVQLSTAWPDYVFEKQYNLKSISDLENYIQENKHLPGIPAAAEMKKEGIMLGDMQTRMMEKIEELTLYIIDLNKQNEKLSSEIESLRKAIKN